MQILQFISSPQTVPSLQKNMEDEGCQPTSRQYAKPRMTKNIKPESEKSSNEIDEIQRTFKFTDMVNIKLKFNSFRLEILQN